MTGGAHPNTGGGNGPPPDPGHHNPPPGPPPQPSVGPPPPPTFGDLIQAENGRVKGGHGKGCGHAQPEMGGLTCIRETHDPGAPHVGWDNTQTPPVLTQWMPPGPPTPM